MSAGGRSADARLRVLEAATARFAREGTIAARLTDIGADAGVSIGAIYHHFPDKQALAEAAAEHALGLYQDAFLAELERHVGAREGVGAIVAFHIQWSERHADAARLLLQGAGPAGARLNKGFFERVLSWYRSHTGVERLRRLPVRTLYALWLGPATIVVRDRLEHGGPGPARKEVEVLAEAAWLTLSERADEAGR